VQNQKAIKVIPTNGIFASKNGNLDLEEEKKASGKNSSGDSSPSL